MTPKSKSRAARTRTRTQRGFSIVEVVVVMCLLTVAICTAALLTIKGILQARHARVRTDAQTTASALVNSPAPAGTGGSVAPDAPVVGWSDVVFVNPETGQFEPLTGRLPEGAVPIRRQWRVAPTGTMRVYSVSAEIMSPDATTPLPDAQGGGAFVLNRVLR